MLNNEVFGEWQLFCGPELCFHPVQDHYEQNPSHRLTKQDHDGFRKNAELVRYFRMWNFPRYRGMPNNQCMFIFLKIELFDPIF